ncbi:MULTISPECIES: hypothetical protein [unclassified Caulobacter]|uniref:hypothetical protein n=1 Tax=unclassified Caulobacter TaxID=2648921 RepID=UPI0006FC9450|nr:MULTISPECIES: hypothetical protein [unclassified Caulobacter]KQV57298.1 hypothetical protein ASC62_13615 [Caulobacter sp. Root342]KQV66870.1 hypothetical protein ASC70_13715 [Caulobacter sp. Root343]
MSTTSSGVRFSIRPAGRAWFWSAVRDGAVLGEGLAGSRAIAAAFVIRQICRACDEETAGEIAPVANAA